MMKKIKAKQKTNSVIKYFNIIELSIPSKIRKYKNFDITNPSIYPKVKYLIYLIFILIYPNTTEVRIENK